MNPSTAHYSGGFDHSPDPLAAALRTLSSRLQQREMAEMEHAISFLEICIETIHHLQLERGRSCLHLASGASGPHPSLESIRQAVDRHLGKLRSFSEGILKENLAVSSRSVRSLAALLETIADLTCLREAVGSGRSDCARTFQDLTRIIDALFDTAFSVAATGSPVHPCGLRLTALYYLSLSKEHAGRERALVAEALARVQLGDAARTVLVRNLDEMEGALSVADALCPPDAELHTRRTRLVEKLEPHRRAIFASDAQNFRSRLGPEIWFDLATELVETLRSEECLLVSRLKCDLADARTEATTFAESSRDRSESAPMLSEPDLCLFFPRNPWIRTPINLPEPQIGMARPIGTLLAEFAKKLERAIAERDAARSDLDQRKIVERAKGILMKQYQLSEHQAYERLRSEAMRRSAKLHEVARALTEMESLFRP